MKIIKSLLRQILVGLLGVAAASACWAMSLGNIIINSELGRPFEAYIEVLEPEGSFAELTVLVKPLPFRSVNRNANRLASIGPVDGGFLMRNGRAYIRLQSRKPITEPAFNIALDVRGGNINLNRDYNVLLSPTGLQSFGGAVNGGNEAIAVAPQPEATLLPPAASVNNQNAEPAPEPQKSPESGVAPEANKPDVLTPGGSVTISKGDTLYSISRRITPPDLQVNQVIMAIFRDNRDAFLKNSPDHMLANKVLQIPSRERIIEQSTLGAPEGMSEEVFAHYRDGVADASKRLAPRKNIQVIQKGSGSIKKVVPPSVSSKETLDKLTLRQPDDKQTHGKPSVEEVLASEKAKATQQHIASLQKNITDLEQLVKLQNEKLGKMQEQSKAAATSPAKPVEVTPEAPKETPEISAVEVPVAAKPAETSPAPVAVQKTAAEKLNDALQALQKIDWMPISGLAILGLAALWFFVRRRRRLEVDDNEFLEPILTKKQAPATEIAEFDDSVIISDFSESAQDEGSIDVLAEADVYLAYNRFDQAEEILVDALDKDDSRSDVLLKLLEVYRLRGNGEMFSQTLERLRQQTSEEGSIWQQALLLAKDATAAPTPQQEPEVESGLNLAIDDNEIENANDGWSDIPVAKPSETAKPAVVKAEQPPADVLGQTKLAELAQAFDGLNLSGVSGSEKPPEKPAEKPPRTTSFLDLDEPVIGSNPPPIFDLPKVHDAAAAQSNAEAQEFVVDEGENAFTEVAQTGEAPLDFGKLGFDLELDKTPPAEVAPKPAANDPAQEIGRRETDLNAPLEKKPEQSTGVTAADIANMGDLSLTDDAPPVIELHDASEWTDSDQDAEVTIDNINAEDELLRQESLTKIELAKAYNEMGDTEAARELLDEVLQTGLAELRAAAQQLRDSFH